MNYRVVSGALAALVANAGTFTIAYPDGTDAGTYYGGVGHEVGINGNLFTVPTGFALTFGTSSITVTNNTGGSLAAGTKYTVTLGIAGTSKRTIKRTSDAVVQWVTIGAPDTKDADGVCASQTPLAAGALTLNGALVPASSTVAVFDVPRGVSVASAGVDTTRVFTITGTDEYGETLVETITGVNAGTVNGKKAFKRVTRVSVDAATAGAITVGSTDVLGLPVFLMDSDFVLKEMEDGTARTNGTFVAGDQTDPSATTGDVRGTYDPNAACNGALTFRLLIATAMPDYVGLGQYDG